VKRALEAGCDLHVSKPVKKRVLLETIRNRAFPRAADVGTPTSDGEQADAVPANAGAGAAEGYGAHARYIAKLPPPFTRQVAILLREHAETRSEKSFFAPIAHSGDSG
jgi:hypothetical protein